MQSALVPLLFRLNDQLPSVAKVWISRLNTGMGGTDTSQRSQGLGQELLAAGSAAPGKGPCGTSTSRGGQGGSAMFNTCPACSSRAWQQPVATEAALEA